LVERAFGRLNVEPAPVHGYWSRSAWGLHGVRQGHHLHLIDGSAFRAAACRLTSCGLPVGAVSEFLQYVAALC
jgi:hypothetical protein